MALVMQQGNNMRAAAAMTVSLLKLRIGVAIAASALAGIAVASGPGLAVVAGRWASRWLFSAPAGAAGAFNHYYDRDLDRLMQRTRNRPFASGAFGESLWWPVAFVGLLAVSLGLASLTAGHVAAAYVFLGAFTYGIVYTVWLKRRSTWNIVVGGLAGSFAVLAGAAAVDPSPQVVPTVLAVVLFLWTPPHFWSLAAAKGQDYARAGIPMLPVVAPARAWTMAILAHSVALALISMVPLWFGQGLLYGIGAASRRRLLRLEERQAVPRSVERQCDGEFLRIAGATRPAGRRRAAVQRGRALVMMVEAPQRAWCRCWPACRSHPLTPRLRHRRSIPVPRLRQVNGRWAGPIGDYRLVDSTGAPLSLRDYRGKPLVISLVYSACSSVCPPTTQHLIDAVNEAGRVFGPERFAVLTVGFDARNDTVARMAQFASVQGIKLSNWRVASGDAATIEALLNDLGFSYRAVAGGFDHPTQTTIVDRGRQDLPPCLWR